MCEPNHSIVQYPDHDPDSGDPTGSKVEAITPKTGWLKKILRWFHLSKLGSGHSGAVASVRHEGLLPSPFLYESHWWDRSVHADGFRYFNIRRDSLETQEQLAKESLECAEEYSKRVVIGNLSMLRRFLETSVKLTDNPGMYFSAFVAGMVAKNKKDVIVKKLNGVCPKWDRSWRSLLFSTMSPDQKTATDRAIKVMLGFTRRRENLCSAWADDASLWTPDQNGCKIQLA